jgi:DNA/RNA endonuclease G (NUC1)
LGLSDATAPFKPGGGAFEAVDSFINPRKQDHPALAAVMDNLDKRGNDLVEGTKEKLKETAEDVADIVYYSTHSSEPGAVAKLTAAAQRHTAAPANEALGMAKGFGQLVKRVGNAGGDIAYYGSHSEAPGATGKLVSAVTDVVLDAPQIVLAIDGAANLAKGAAGAWGKDATPRPDIPAQDVPYGELDLTSPREPSAGQTTVPAPQVTEDSLQLDYGRQPAREVPYRELDLTSPHEPIALPAGTGNRRGRFFHEYNAAEITSGLRVDYNVAEGRPNVVTYRVDAGIGGQSTVTDRYFTGDMSVEGAQSRNAAYAGSGYDRGHLAQREAFKGSAETERAVDQFTNVVPMHPDLNRGAGSPWRASEADTIRLADQYGSVSVRVEPIYDAKPARLADRTPIPKAIRRTVTSPNGTVLRDATFLNQ